MRLDKEGLAAEIDKLFADAEVKITTPAGVVRAGREPVDLKALCARHVDFRDEFEEFKDWCEEYDDYFKDAVELLDPIDVMKEVGKVRLLILFEWQSIGPMVSNAELYLVELPSGRGIVVLAPDIDLGPPVAIAALEPRPSRELLSMFLRDLLEGNGIKYGTELWGFLPTRTENYASDLIPEQAVREAYRAWLEFCRQQGYTIWAMLLEQLELERRAKHPSLAGLRFLDELAADLGIKPPTYKGECERYPKRDTSASERDETQNTVTRLVAWAEETQRREQQREQALTDDDRQAIMDWYFEQGYIELEPTES